MGLPERDQICFFSLTPFIEESILYPTRIESIQQVNNMKKYNFSKSLALIFGLSMASGIATAESQSENPFHPSYSSAETITVAFKGKPPYKNRAQHLAQLRAQQAARAETEALEKTELSALEIGDETVKSTSKTKKFRRKTGHPYHR